MSGFIMDIEIPESVMDAVAEALGGAYDCTRVWNAWNVGTMSQDDFCLVSEDGDRVREITEAAITAYLTATPAAKAAKAEVRAEQMVPEEWREQFAQAVYADLAAADNQDVPLEEYPGRILKVLYSIVGPHHPTVVYWRNDAIRACIEIVKRYGAGTTAYQERDMAALYTAPQAQPADALVAERIDDLYIALEVCAAELFAQCGDQGRAMKYVEQARKALATEQCARAATPPVAKEG